MFALLMELYVMIRVSILLQPHRTVVANFVPGKCGLFRRNPWQPQTQGYGEFINLITLGLEYKNITRAPCFTIV